jgi:hypothetical protein
MGGFRVPARQLNQKKRLEGEKSDPVITEKNKEWI